MNLPPSDDKAAPIQQRKLYDANDIVQWQDSEPAQHGFAEEVEQVAEQTLRPKRRTWSLLTRLAMLALLVGVIVQLVVTLIEAWQRSSLLFITYTGIFAILTLWLLALVVKEWRYLRQLKGSIDGQQVAERLKVSVQMGEAPGFIGAITARLPADAIGCVKQLNQSLSPNQNDAEQIRLFEAIVLDDRDKAARRIVRKFALQSSLILAVSPFALLDMVLVLWRNQAMIKQIAACYGIELGYWSRVRLIRGIFWNIIYAGTSELMTDFGSQMLSMEMTGKLSARLAQGLGGGLLTARLGLQAMRLCRPVKFNEQNQPSLTKIHMELLKELKQRMAKSEQAATGTDPVQRN
ncbi:TIGR01620 family protein [Shewanella sp.]|uniref:TIGR01620 family protein n=1 Tax=Shewanella sp. TaxID=50422 RepID=UPI003A96E28E